VPAALGAASSRASTLGLAVGEATGDWHDIGAYHGTARGRLFSAWLEHGAGGGVAGETYAYAIFPAAPAAAVPALAAALGGVDRACVANGGGVQGAAHAAAGVAEVVFWEASGGAWGPCAAARGLAVASAGAAVVVVRDGARGAVAVSAASPTERAPAAAAVTVRGRGALVGAGCAPAPGGGTLFTIPFPADAALLGKTVTVECAPAPAD